MGLKWVMETFMGTKTVAQLRAEEHNEKALCLLGIWGARSFLAGQGEGAKEVQGR